MRTIGYLSAAAVGGALLAVAVSGWVSTQVPAVMSMSGLAQPASESEPSVVVRPREDGPSVRLGHDEESRAVEAPRTGTASRSASHSSRNGTTGRRGHPVAPRSSPDARDELGQVLEQGIHPLGEHRYEIERNTLERALGNLVRLAGWVKVAPEIRAGKPVGFRLSAVAAEGPFAKLGLRDGDLLVSVNGLAIATPENVLEAYGKLRTARRLTVGVVRAGRESAFEYVIR